MPKLERMRKAFTDHKKPDQAARRALTYLRQAEQELRETDWDYARSLVEEAMAAIPTGPECGMKAETLWLASAHSEYTSEELADVLEISVLSVAKRINTMHGHFREAAGRDIKCHCGHPFGHFVYPCHS